MKWNVNYNFGDNTSITVIAGETGDAAISKYQFNIDTEDVQNMSSYRILSRLKINRSYSGEYGPGKFKNYVTTVVE
jgi:hypothetical protein